MKKAELHCHTHNNYRRYEFLPLFYDSPNSPEDIVDECLKKDIKILAVTDHDSLWGYKETKKIIEKENLDIILIPAVEVTSSEGHILALGVTKLIPRKMSARKTVDMIQQQDGLAILAHPGGPIMMKPGARRADFDAVEIYNSGANGWMNSASKSIGRKMNLPGVVGSDAHTKNTLGNATVMFDDEIKTWQGVLRAIKKNEFEIVIETPQPISSSLMSFVNQTKIRMSEENGKERLSRK